MEAIPSRQHQDAPEKSPDISAGYDCHQEYGASMAQFSRGGRTAGHFSPEQCFMCAAGLLAASENNILAKTVL
ncbi:MULTISPECIES: hypothetical protein [unclassified Janthinobacterium]|uniref:hypothetical protein n=1 Tax=unclassified Janthinobacterium TaxID=2610881 RepID=UPI001113D73D|nr:MULTISPECIES: hypothetical protein [unclassified Janthinobacterium]